ncbi:851_t:CDS:2 [Dentiscutata erythropus]|uniref:851_t:CDS:1 n=1 Tax=Dentiscutata erythropus TaxID=1348616 RepID=A0A9N8VEL5_9GLOM|nr:851_t:CDS:2 [Dentiscutata erythropus]
MRTSKPISNILEESERKDSELVHYSRKEKAKEEKGEEKINSLEKIISKMQKELEKKDKEFTRYSERVDQHEEKIDNIKKTISNMRDEQETKDNNLVGYQMKLVQVESQLSETKKKLEREKKIREILNSFYDELIQTCVEKALLKKEIEILEKESKELEHKQDKDDDRIKILSDVEQLKNLLNGKQSKEKLIRDKIDLVQIDTDEVSNEFYEIQNEKSRLLTNSFYT